MFLINTGGYIIGSRTRNQTTNRLNMESLLQLTTRTTDMPNQEEFMNLMVEPADIRSQSCNWETSKRVIEVQLSKQSPKHQIETCEHWANLHESESLSANKIDDSISEDTSELDDVEFKVITFVIGAANERDTSKPSPPPSKFVRKGGFQQ